ncbi:LMWPc-domain-containing protein [Wallemia mellicola]|nr:LMWPc-domain-containing protein [Wallemia mellicola]TIC26368.1 LMWPc-domain-containing protein [Wallemia mellicola]
MSKPVEKKVLAEISVDLDTAMAEGVLTHLKDQNNLPIYVESAGTAAYHEGEYADDRTIATLQKHGIPMNSLARKVRQNDFQEFDYILAMDGSNLSNLLRIAPKNCKADIKLFGSYLDGKAIQDPYYGGQSNVNLSINTSTDSI